ADAELRAALQEKSNIEAGFSVINNYGCYACHNIKGFEKMGKPSVDLTKYGRKDVHELYFGDAKVDNTWEAWTDNKLKNPQIYADERNASTMPKPNVNDEQRKALLVFLRGQRPEDLPQKYIAYDSVVEKGRQLVQRYNCRSCHVIEGEGGLQDQSGNVPEWVEGGANFLPPHLASVGARLQTRWMYQFLKNPAHYPKVRDWLNLRMPTFGFTDEEADHLIAYFKKIAGVETLLEDIPSSDISLEDLEAARALTSNKVFYCASCHIINKERPAAGPSVWAPNLAYGNHRLRPQWINQWVRNPAKFVPGTRMPGFYLSTEDPDWPQDILGGDADRQVEAIVNYILYLGHQGSVIREKSLKEEGSSSAVEEKTSPKTEPETNNQAAEEGSSAE
ncbi:MAG: c-type cytochrome, partial [Deltaproteobacteria bacterium]|nr:c-type cytochrome [Deltaproteobacteria bacterium]